LALLEDFVERGSRQVPMVDLDLRHEGNLNAPVEGTEGEIRVLEETRPTESVVEAAELAEQFALVHHVRGHETPALPVANLADGRAEIGVRRGADAALERANAALLQRIRGPDEPVAPRQDIGIRERDEAAASRGDSPVSARRLSGA